MTKEELLEKSNDELRALLRVDVYVGTHCNGYIECTHCTRCRDCNECTDCHACFDCFDCNNCFDCSNCTECNDCNRCKECTYCTKCVECIGIKKGKNLQYVVYGVQLSKEEFEEKFGVLP
jgi:hypothetical protein